MNTEKKLIIIAIFFYVIIGILLSINTGFSHDEFHEQLNWLKNIEAYKSIFGLGDYNVLSSYEDRYHGIAFQLISQPFQFLVSNYISNIVGTTLETSNLLSKHIVIFLLFSISGIFFYRLSYLLTNSKYFSIISSSLYLIFPYLFGHSLINPKDIPFLVFWLISTYYYFKIIKLIFFEKKVLFLHVIKLSFFTAFLISTRILGLLIFIEFLIGFVVLQNFKNINFLKLIRANFKNISYYLIFLFVLLFFINPIFWNPLEIFHSIKWMSKYHNDVCTLILGKCEKSLNLPADYYFKWLFFKLPIISLLGILIIPINEKKLLSQNFSSVVFLTILLTIITLILIFILKKIAIYDELRHILFIVPLILLISFYNIYLLSKNFFVILSVITLLFFLVDNIKIYPYQYTWLNEFSRFYDINKNFELDYWGTSNKKLQLKIIELKKNQKFDNDICVYGDIYTSAYLKKTGFSCFDQYNKIDSVKNRPFIAYQNLRNLKKNPPYNCNLLYTESFNYLFSKQNLIAGKVWYCF